MLFHLILWVYQMLVNKNNNTYMRMAVHFYNDN